MGNVPSWTHVFTARLFKKVVLADGISEYSTPTFDAALHGVAPSFIASWGAAFAYAFQIYFDFSGYSDMAIGLGYMFGIKLPFNFNSPYKATSIIDFWRRWHITLSRFLKHYVYIPLGGNVKGKTRRYINLMLTMLVGGLWHGANWTFVVWGGLHGMYLVINHGWRKFRRNQRETIIYEWAARVCTMLAVVFAWVFFRAESFSAAKLMFEGMLGFHGILPTSVVEQNQTVSALFRFVNISIQPGVEAWICLLIIWCIALLSIVRLCQTHKNLFC